jgi:NAD(P)H-dependent FMN reductase
MTTILTISGSMRAGSTNAAALDTARAVASAGIEVRSYGGPGRLPHFNPDDDHEPLPASVAELRAAIEAADGVLFCTPEYAGALPGSFKNMLDWTIGGGEIYQKPVAWINVAAPGRGEGALATLRTVLGYAGTLIVEAACVRVPVLGQQIGPDGLITDEAVRKELAGAVSTLADARLVE